MPFSEAHTERGTNVLRRLSLSSAFTKVTTLSTHLKKTFNITSSPHLTWLLEYHPTHLQVLHQIQLLVQHPRLPLSQINPIALQLLALMVESRAGSLLLWENAYLKVTSMASINLAPLFPSRLLGFVTARASNYYFFGHLRLSTHYYPHLIPATAP